MAHRPPPRQPPLQLDQHRPALPGLRHRHRAADARPRRWHRLLPGPLQPPPLWSQRRLRLRVRPPQPPQGWGRRGRPGPARPPAPALDRNRAGEPPLPRRPGLARRVGRGRRPVGDPRRRAGLFAAALSDQGGAGAGFDHLLPPLRSPDCLRRPPCRRDPGRPPLALPGRLPLLGHCLAGAGSHPGRGIRQRRRHRLDRGQPRCPVDGGRLPALLRRRRGPRRRRRGAGRGGGLRPPSLHLAGGLLPGRGRRAAGATGVEGLPGDEPALRLPDHPGPAPGLGSRPGEPFGVARLGLGAGRPGPARDLHHQPAPDAPAPTGLDRRGRQRRDPGPERGDPDRGLPRSPAAGR